MSHAKAQGAKKADEVKVKRVTLVEMQGTFGVSSLPMLCDDLHCALFRLR